MLEQAGVAALVGGRADDQDIGGGEPRDQVARRGIELTQTTRLAQGRAEILDVEGGRGRTDAGRQLSGDVIDEGPGLGRAGNVARHSQHKLC